MDATLQRALQAERIAGRKEWVRFVEIETTIHRAHTSRIDDELAPILDDLMRHRAARLIEPHRV